MKLVYVVAAKLQIVSLLCCSVSDGCRKDDPRVGWHGAAGDRVSEWKPKTEGTTGQRGQSGSVEDGWVGRVCCPVSSTGGVEITLVQPSTPDFIRSVPGEWVQTNILVKLIKRTRRPKNRPTGSTVTVLLLRSMPTNITASSRSNRVIPLTVRLRGVRDHSSR